jgi:transposase
MARSSSLPHRQVVQARALLLAADGVATNEVARQCGTTSDSVRAWRRRFEAEGPDGIGRIAPGRGRKPWLAEGTAAEVVHLTCTTVPDDDSTQWSTRTLAERVGVGKDTVARIWRAHGLRPWRRDTFKLSNDPAFTEKLVDVVGLYVGPPARERAVVLYFDEKPRCRRWTAPSPACR